VLTAHAEAIRALGKRVVADIIEIGRRLAECKTIVGHGNWLPWLEREFGWSDRTAERYINAHDLAGKFDTVSNLDLPLKALYLLAASSTPKHVQAQVIERAGAGEKLTHAQIKQAIAAGRSNHRGRQQPATNPCKKPEPDPQSQQQSISAEADKAACDSVADVAKFSASDKPARSEIAPSDSDQSKSAMGLWDYFNRRIERDPQFAEYLAAYATLSTVERAIELLNDVAWELQLRRTGGSIGVPHATALGILKTWMAAPPNEQTRAINLIGRLLLDRIPEDWVNTVNKSNLDTLAKHLATKIAAALEFLPLSAVERVSTLLERIAVLVGSKQIPAANRKMNKSSMENYS
jgi:hypothetical protein